MKHTFFSKCTKMPFRYRTAFLLSRIGNLTILAGILLGGCQAGGSIWKETISLEPKDKTVSEETLDPETDIDGQVESEQVDGAELRVEMQGQDESGKLESEPGENDSNECSLLFAGDIYFSNHVLNAYDRVGGIGGVLGESLRETIAESDIFMATWNFRSATGEHRRRINSLRSGYRRPACLFYRRSDQTS